MKYENKYIIFIIGCISYSILIFELINKNYKIIFFYYLLFGVFFLFFQNYAFILALLFLIIIILYNFFTIKEYQTEKKQTDYDKASDRAKDIENELNENLKEEENKTSEDKTTNCRVSATQVLTEDDPPESNTESEKKMQDERQSEVRNVFDDILKMDPGNLSREKTPSLP